MVGARKDARPLIGNSQVTHRILWCVVSPPEADPVTRQKVIPGGTSEGKRRQRLKGVPSSKLAFRAGRENSETL